MNSKYKIIYADPAWRYNDKGCNGACENHYKTMSIKELCALPVADIAADDSVLFLWTTMPMLEDAFKLIKSWGFTYKTVAFTWVKLNPKSKTIFKGLGRWVMGNAEIVLLCTKGKPKRLNKNVSQIVMAERGRHSAKPDEVRRRIVQLMGNQKRVELFAREKKPGWDVWGNEVDSDISLNTTNNEYGISCNIAL